MRPTSGSILVLVANICIAGCSGSDTPSGVGGAAGIGGEPGAGGTQAAPVTGGAPQTGGQSNSAAATGGKSTVGGSTSNLPVTGGTSTGGASATGVPSTGGSRATGGAAGSGGTRATGGAMASGGTRATGGAMASGGTRATGGAMASGGSSTGAGTGGASALGGRTATGGVTSSGGTRPAGGASSSIGGTTSGGSSGDVKPSSGCGKTPTLKNSTTGSANQNTLTVSGASRQFVMRWPTNYDNTHPYRLILDFHGAGGKDTDLAPSYFGLFDLSNNSTIFVAPSASGGYWDATADLTFVDQILTTVEGDLCIDTSRVELEGFSQGGAMVAVLACQRPGVFRAAVGHSRGGLTAPSTCQPIPYLGSLGLSDISGNSQATQTDPFAKWNGCTVTTMPLAPTGNHVCTNYTGCPAADPVIFCSFDGPHTASPTDSGKSTSWMPQTVWSFLSAY